MNDEARQRRLQLLRLRNLTVGDRVLYGEQRGTLTQEWGQFYGCPECSKLVESPMIKCCGRVPNSISGKGIFEVKLDNGDTKSINEWWLEKLDTE